MGYRAALKKGPSKNHFMKRVIYLLVWLFLIYLQTSATLSEWNNVILIIEREVNFKY